MPGKEFKIQPFKTFNNFKVDPNKQMSEVRKSIQDPDQRVSGVDENVFEKAEQCNGIRGEFSKEITILENNQTEMSKMKANQ